jgi:hypothetical protein
MMTKTLAIIAMRAIRAKESPLAAGGWGVVRRVIFISFMD